MKFGEIINISIDTSFYSSSPQIAYSYKNNSLYVIWHKSRGIYGDFARKHKEKNASIVYRVSKDNGKTFGDAATLHDFSEPESFGPSIAFSPLNGNRIFLAWVDKSSPRKLDVYFSRNSEDGSRFEKPVIISDEETGICSNDRSNRLSDFHLDRPETYDRVTPYIAAGSDNNVYVMWVESTSTRIIEPIRPEPENEATNSASFGPDEMEKAAKYMQNMFKKNFERAPKYEYSAKIFLRASNDGGKTFGKKISILNTKFSGRGGGPQLTSPASLHAIAKNVYIIIDAFGRDPDNSTTRIFASTDTGHTFEERTVLLSKSVSGIGRKVVSARAVLPAKQPDSLYLLLEVVNHGDEDLFPTPFSMPRTPLILLKSTNAGKTFSDPVHVGVDSPTRWHSSFAVSPDGRNVHVAYIDMSSPMDDFLGRIRKGMVKDPQQEIKQAIEVSDSGSIFVRSSNNGGISFDELAKLEGSKNIGPISSFATHILMLPSDDKGLYIFRSRYVASEQREAEEKPNYPSAEALLWHKNQGSELAEGPIKVSGDYGESDGTLGIIIEKNDKKPAEMYVVWQTTRHEANYSETFFRGFTI